MTDLLQMDDRWKSRKFWVFVALFAASLILAWFQPALVGTASVLFNFWMMIAGIFFGTDVYGKYQVAKNNGGEMPDHKWRSKKFIVLVGLLTTSYALAWFLPLFVASGQALFAFWAQICGLYFAGNVAEKQLQGRAQRVSTALKENPSAKVPID
jgi:cation transport ATPase